MRAKERLVCIRVRDGALTLTTMLFETKFARPRRSPRRSKPPSRPREQVESAVAVIEELGVEFDPTLYRDEHRAHLKRIIKRKQQGKKIQRRRLLPRNPSPEGARSDGRAGGEPFADPGKAVPQKTREQRWSPDKRHPKGDGYAIPRQAG